MHISQRVRLLTPALTLSVSARAKAMQNRGIDVCNFSAGRPEFDTPDHIKAAAQRALDEGKTKYGPVGGEPELREVIAHKLRTENGLAYTAENVAVNNGAKHALFNLMMVLLEPGDEVLIHAPYWLSFPEMVKLAGGVPVLIETDLASGYKFTPAELERAITPRTRLLIFNSPSNPSGAVFTPEEIRGIAKVIVDKKLLVVSDEIFEKIVYDGAEHVSIGSMSPEAFARTIVVSGFSKIYSMTGWRVGYMAGPVEIINAVISAQSHSTSNVCSFAQYGGVAAYTDERSSQCVEQMRQAYVQRRRAMMDLLADVPGLRCRMPEGTFYLFPYIGDTGMRSVEFCEALLESQKVAAVAGAVFGADDHIRLSFATDLEVIEKGMKRLASFVRSLS
ncbi:pyridoxal phosphate-dependent aminotransferase [Sorangium sp. So ce1078]|uniref:pyridoxal phosphate-dependent aminotransferase n=1 Tax=Sorangium sp. So ce1078 TaxID=3133329 RepID=UPI003F60ADDF